MAQATRYAMGSSGYGFNKYAAGAKRYGASGRSAPNVGASDKAGYAARDQRIAARKKALLLRAQGK